MVPGSKKPPKKKIYNGLRAPINGVILRITLYGPTFRGIFLRSYTIEKEGIFLTICRIFTIDEIRTTDIHDVVVHIL